MQAVEERICDQPVLKLLRAGVMEDGQVRREAAGSPQGGVVTLRHVQCLPVPAGLAVGRRRQGAGPVRYDLVVVRWSRSQAGAGAALTCWWQVWSKAPPPLNSSICPTPSPQAAVCLSLPTALI